MEPDPRNRKNGNGGNDEDDNDIFPIEPEERLVTETVVLEEDETETVELEDDDDTVPGCGE